MFFSLFDMHVHTHYVQSERIKSADRERIIRKVRQKGDDSKGVGSAEILNGSKCLTSSDELVCVEAGRVARFPLNLSSAALPTDHALRPASCQCTAI